MIWVLNIMDIFNKQEQEREHKAQLALIEEEAKQRQIRFGVTFSSEHGFDTLKDLMKFCHFLESTNVLGDTHDSAFQEGERRVFLYILAQLSPELRSKLLGG